MDYDSPEDAAHYDLLVSAEDCDGMLLPAIEAICPLTGAKVVEVGAGTGRLTRLMAAAGAHVLATEPSAAMLATLRDRLAPPEAPHVRVARASAERLPAVDGAADLCIAGWVLGYQRLRFPDDWRTRVQAALAEMRRVVRPAGAVVLIETLGTGVETPAPPTPELAEYQAFLVQHCNLSFAPSLRTDYAFEDEQAARLAMGAFFGDRGLSMVTRHGHRRIPECTGLWWATVEQALGNRKRSLSTSFSGRAPASGRKAALQAARGAEECATPWPAMGPGCDSLRSERVPKGPEYPAGAVEDRGSRCRAVPVERCRSARTEVCPGGLRNQSRAFQPPAARGANLEVGTRA